MFPIKDSIQVSCVPAITLLVVAVNILVFVIETGLTQDELEFFVQFFGVIPAQFLSLGGLTEICRIFSSMFVHAGLAHLVGNLWFLWIFGDAVEDRLGHAFYLFLYFFTGALAALCQILINPLSIVPMVGASGAISGVLGAYLYLFPRATVSTVLLAGFLSRIVELPAGLYFGIWFLVQFGAGLFALAQADPGAQTIAFWAHISGFLLGILLAKIMTLLQSPPKRPNEFFA